VTPQEIEQHNLEELAGTNQRGGRLLSIVDLIEAGTISSEMAALCWMLVEGGASFLTGAVPGGTGKTTLMTAVLNFLPPLEPIVTTSDEDVIAQAAGDEIETPYCLLAHEIGRGNQHAYIWGVAARLFFSARAPGVRRVTCLHADTPQQAYGALRDCSVRKEDAEDIDFMLFIGSYGMFPNTVRRVTGMYCWVDDELTRTYWWDKEAGQFQSVADRGTVASALVDESSGVVDDLVERWHQRERHLDALVKAGVRQYDLVRTRILTAMQHL